MDSFAMTDKPIRVFDGFHPDLLPSNYTITPQPEPTSPRIKELLSRALVRPATLGPDEVQEMAASVVYFLINRKEQPTKSDH